MSCPRCFSGYIHLDKLPTGREIKLHGLDVYVAEPEGEVQGFIVIIPDAFGWQFINNRVLADNYAAKSDYRVYLPDFMNGYSAPIVGLSLLDHLLYRNTWYDYLWKPYYLARTVVTMVPWAYMNRFTVSFPRVTSFFSALRTHEAASRPLGAAGFCWGGKHAVNLTHENTLAPNGQPFVDSIFIAHPSNLVIPREIEAVQRPLALANGDRDVVLNLAGARQIERILNGIEGVESEVVLYEGAGHGFAIRADPANKDTVRMAEEAEEQAISWFDKCFSKVSY